jgi:UvrD/REP helicase N-terminal domain
MPYRNGPPLWITRPHMVPRWRSVPETQTSPLSRGDLQKTQKPASWWHWRFVSIHMTAVPYLARLNPDQRHAVEHGGPSPLLIIAGAGTGKTNKWLLLLMSALGQKQTS